MKDTTLALILLANAFELMRDILADFHCSPEEYLGDEAVLVFRAAEAARSLVDVGRADDLDLSLVVAEDQDLPKNWRAEVERILAEWEDGT